MINNIDNFLTELYQQDVKFWLETKENNEVKLRFNAPEEVLTPELIEQLKERKPEIIEFLKSAETTFKTKATAIKSVERNGQLPLSFAQQRLWFMEQLQPGGAAYNIPTGVKLTGDLDISILEKSLNEIIRRHEVLRTNFQTESGQPKQIIHDEKKIELTNHDLRELEKEKQEELILKLSSQEVSQPFDLERDLLLRVTLISLSTKEHIILLTMHHIISDGWSMDILVRELIALYKAYGLGEKPALPELTIQYADFAVWQREWLQGEVLEQQLSYWKQQLTGIPVLQLPTDFPRGRVQTFKGANQSFRLGEQLTQQLYNIARQSGVTMFMLLLAAYKVLLSRYSGQDDIIVGVPIANRNRTEIEPLIGFFTNTLVLRSNLASNPTFKQLLAQIKELTYSAYDHQDLPFEKLVEELQPERDLSYNPLFQAKFRLENQSPSVSIPGLTITPLKQTEFAAKLDLSLDMYETPSGLVGGFEYNTDLFKSETISRMVEHFRILLQGIANDPDCRISELPLLTEREIQQRLVDWNDTTVEFQKNLCFHDLFAAQVAKTPDNIALVFEEEELTYSELDRRSNELAAYLSSLGVKPEVRVGICCDRSIEMIVAFLAVLKAGGAYVPLDPVYPQERLDYIVEDSEIIILLTQTKYKSNFNNKNLTTIDLCKGASRCAPTTSTTPALTPDNLAYIIYTSGSTGKPKGVLIPHRGLTNLTEHKIRTCQVDSNSCVLQFFSFSFDASIPEIIMSLGCGAKLCLASSETLLPGEGLLNLMRRQKVTHITMTPSALATLPAAELPDLEMVLVGGEAPSAELIKQWSRDRIFINAYGPTEVTVNASMVYCGNSYPIEPTITPSANKQLYVCDKHLQLVPVGVVGELHIAGVGLARGYLNRPDLTAEKFIPNLFLSRGGGDRAYEFCRKTTESAPQQGSRGEILNNIHLRTSARLYKTGDLACYFPDGRIKLLGRIDNQIKIRGFRIELGEIETLINQHPDVKVSVVIALEDSRGDKYLAAYVVFKSDGKGDSRIASVRKFLSDRIPAYMIPQTIVELEKLPLNPNGKVDLKALSAPEKAELQTDNHFIAPRNDNEAKLVKIYAEILEVERVSISDNFFELGGHSLLATKLVARLLEEFQIDINVIDLFEAPTVEGLALRIEEKITFKEVSEKDNNDDDEREIILI